MPTIETPEQYRERIKLVWVVNESDHTVVLRFNQAEFEFPPKRAERVPQEMAWLWFGNKKTQEEGARAWDREVRMLRERHGSVPMMRDPASQDPTVEMRDPKVPPTAWELIEQNLLYCREFGKGVDLYKDLETHKPVRFVAGVTLEEMQASCGIAGEGGLQPVGAAVADLPGAMESANRQGVAGAMRAAMDPSGVIGGDDTLLAFQQRGGTESAVLVAPSVAPQRRGR